MAEWWLGPTTPGVQNLYTFIRAWVGWGWGCDCFWNGDSYIDF